MLFDLEIDITIICVFDQWTRRLLELGVERVVSFSQKTAWKASYKLQAPGTNNYIASSIERDLANLDLLKKPQQK